MRRLGVCVVLLGVVTLGFMTTEAIWTPFSRATDLATERENALALQRLIFWTVFVGLAALATLFSGLGDVMMARCVRRRTDLRSDRNGETAARIDAAGNDGRLPAPVPCERPAARSVSQETPRIMSETPLIPETCPAPDRIVHLPLGQTVGTAKSMTLLKSDRLELLRLVIPAGKEIPPHKAPGEITVQCIEGLIAFERDGHTIEMRPGDLLHLCPQEIHALKGLVNSSVLVTRLRPLADELPETLSSS